MAGSQAIYDLLCKLCGNDKELLEKLCDVYEIVSELPTEIPPCPPCPDAPKCASSTVCYNVQEKILVNIGSGDCDPADLELGDTICSNVFLDANGNGGSFSLPPSYKGVTYDGSQFCWILDATNSGGSVMYPVTYIDVNGKHHTTELLVCSGGTDQLTILLDNITEYKCMICDDGEGPSFFDIATGKKLEESPQGELTSCFNQINIPPCPQCTEVIFPDHIQLERVEGCVSGVSAYREDTITNGVRVEGPVVTQTPITGDFSPYPCSYVPCDTVTCDIETANCCCFNDMNVDITQLSGGYVNQLLPCDCGKSGDFSFKFKMCNFVNDALFRIGVTDNCGSTSISDLDHGFYILTRANISIPYSYTYIVEGSGIASGTTWVNYERVGIPKCVEYEIRRVGANIEYYVEGVLKYTRPDLTGGATLFPYANIHGTWAVDGSFDLTNINFCEIV